MWRWISARPWAVRLLQLLLVVMALGAWEYRGATSRKFQFFFSRPSRIAVRAWDWLTSLDIYRHAGLTLAETATGFAVGVSLGLTLALICYYSPLVHRLIEPFMDIANAMPRVVFGPLFILWFGLGMMSKAMLAASLVLFIVFFGTLAGLKEVDNHIVQKVKLFGAGPKDLLVHVLLPSALSWVFSGLRSSIGFALAGAVVGEYVGSSRGIGYQIALAEGTLDATGIFAGLVILAAIVIGLNYLLGMLERFLTPWKTCA
jgi:NitT/TauT family transport system permease protein